MITKIILTFFVMSIFIAPVLIGIGWFLENNYYGVCEVIGSILQAIGVVAYIIDAIIVIYGIIVGTVKLIWE